MFSTKEQGFQWYQALWSILTTKHKNIKNSSFFLPQEHFPIKFFLEPSIIASPTFRAENNVLKKGWAQIALFFLKLFLKPVLEKKRCRFSLHICSRSVTNNLRKYLVHVTKHGLNDSGHERGIIKEIKNVWELPVLLDYDNCTN